MKKIGHNVHHRLPVSRGGDDSERNRVLVPIHLHEAYHRLFGNSTPQEIAKILNETWISTEYQFAVLKRNPDRSTTDY